MGVKKKVLIITRWFPNVAEPAKCVFTKNIIDAQAKSNKYSFVVISPVPYFPNIKLKYFKKYSKFNDIPAFEKYDNYIVFRPKYFKLPGLIFRSFEWYAYTKTIYKTIKNNNLEFDLIHAHGIYPDGFVAEKIGKYFNKKIVLHLHESNVGLYKNSALHKKTLKDADVLIPVSSYQMREVEKIAQKLKYKCRVIYNGIKIKEASKEVDRCLDKSLIRIVFIGLLIQRKGLDILLKALTYLNEYKVRLDIIGDGDNIIEYKELVTQYGMKESVRFIGTVDNENIMNILPEYDFLVLPTRAESFGMVLIEAMSAGIPVISTKVGPIPEIIDSDDVGILVEPDNPKDLAKGIVKAFNKRWDRVEIKKYAKKFSIDKTAEKIEKVYDELLRI